MADDVEEAVEGDDRVLIAHPDIDAVGGPVPLAAFHALWESKGWRIVDDADTDTKKTSRRVPRAAPTEG